MTFLESVGLLALSYIAVQLGLFVYRLLSPTRVEVKKFGQWALITGSTDGIGRAYAFELAKRGLKVILISRTEEKLKQVAEEIRSKYGEAEVRVIPIDFTKDSSIYATIGEQIRGLDIGILINNVGMGYDHPENFEKIEQNETFVRNMIRCNVDSVANLTQMILPEMIKKRRGLIINVSSVAGRRPIPLLSLYSATKGFIDLFSRSLSAECLARGVYVQSLCPGYVVSKLSGIRKPSLLAPTPENYVRSSLDRLTLPFTTGYWTHEIQELFASLLPEALSNPLLIKRLSAIRARALQKKAKEQ